MPVIFIFESSIKCGTTGAVSLMHPFFYHLTNNPRQNRSVERDDHRICGLSCTRPPQNIWELVVKRCAHRVSSYSH